VRVARYLLWRALRGVAVLLTMIALTMALYFAVETKPPVMFFFPAVSRGQPVTPAELKVVDHLFYLDRSKVGLYFDYVAHLARGDFGRYSTIDPDGKLVDVGPVAPLYLREVRATLSILVGGAILVLLLSLPLGAISGSRIGSWRDRVISFGALVLVCTHPMMLGLILRSGGGRVNWLPTTGYCPLVRGSSDPCGGPVDWATHLGLRWLTFALLFLALYTRMVRASVAETIHEDFVRTARAKGASQARVLGRHVLPSASLRVLTMVGMEIGTAIGVCIYIESAFGIGGIGSGAVSQLGGGNPFLNLPSDLAIVVLITLIVVIGNLAVDLLYATVDPRVGVERGTQRTKSLVGGVF
jgi:peptide/nickel transport system permease protein